MKLKKFVQCTSEQEQVKIRLPVGVKDFSNLRSRQTGTAPPPQSHVQWAPKALSSCLKRPGNAGGHTPPSSADVKNGWNDTSTLSWRPQEQLLTVIRRTLQRLSQSVTIVFWVFVLQGLRLSQSSKVCQPWLCYPTVAPHLPNTQKEQAINCYAEQNITNVLKRVWHET